MANTYLVTGANRGLGLELTRQLAARGDTVLAAARRVSDELARLPVRVLTLDVGDPRSIAALAGQVGDAPIDALVNNAGVSAEGKTLESLTAEDLERAFRVNSTGPALVTAALLKNLRAGAGRKIMNLSSQLGSIANNAGGSSYGYRASKAALNMITVSTANELRAEGFACFAVHPGWVRTDMGGEKAPLSPEQSVRDLIALLDRAGPAENGRFLDHAGRTLPW